MAKVAIIMGSENDLQTMKDAAKTLEEFGIEYKLTIVSAHRTPERMFEFAKNAEKEFDAIIAGAGGAAHLPGMVASLTRLPVIGVPIKTEALNGIDSLHSIVQMPKGVVVATVAIGNASNAGILAAEIIALKDKKVLEKLEAFRKKQTEEVIEKAKKLEAIGWQKFSETK